MIKKEHICVALVLIHLLMATLFIWTNIEHKKVSGIYHLMRVYRDISGCFRDYTYFAPNVASDTRAGFIIEDKNCDSRFLAFKAGNGVVNTRYKNIVATSMRNPKGRDLFAGSWAAAMFGKGQDVQHVTVFAEAYLVPSISEYRQGKRPEWKMMYVNTFDKQENETITPDE